MAKTIIDVTAIKEYEERGLAMLEKHRKSFIKVGNKSTTYFFKHMFKEYVVASKEGDYIFKPSSNPDCKLLAVAHLDTVICPKKRGFSWNRGSMGGLECVRMTTADDRLGLATILFVLPELGIEYDLLLTDQEEVGNSTAKLFETDKKYNWIVEFDRAESSLSGGNDAVTYMYDGKEWHSALEVAGFKKIGSGTVSDISNLQGLGAKAVNIAIGYMDYHSPKAYFRVGEWARAWTLFKAFYDLHRDTAFAHEYVAPKAITTWYRRCDDYDYYPSAASVANSSGIQRPLLGLKYRSGDVVMTTGHGRLDGEPQIVEITSNVRGAMWTCLDDEGYVADVISSTLDISYRMICPMCNEPVRQSPETPRWVEYRMLYAVCGWCWDVCQHYPDTILASMIHDSMVEIGGETVMIDAVDEDGAIVTTAGGQITFIPIGLCQEAVAVQVRGDTLEIGGKATIKKEYMQGWQGPPAKYIVVSIKGDEVCIRKADCTEEWTVPARYIEPIIVPSVPAERSITV